MWLVFSRAREHAHVGVPDTRNDADMPNLREYGSQRRKRSTLPPWRRPLHYDWPSSLQPLSASMEVHHVWTSIPKGTDRDGNGVFASSQMWWHHDNGTQLAGGYMGSQVMARGDGSERRVIFSCWDHSKKSRVGWTTPQTCTRFGGEGVGSHCILDYPSGPVCSTISACAFHPLRRVRTPVV